MVCFQRDTKNNPNKKRSGLEKICIRMLLRGTRPLSAGQRWKWGGKIGNGAGQSSCSWLDHMVRSIIVRIVSGSIRFCLNLQKFTREGTPQQTTDRA